MKKSGQQQRKKRKEKKTIERALERNKLNTKNEEKKKLVYSMLNGMSLGTAYGEHERALRARATK